MSIRRGEGIEGMAHSRGDVSGHRSGKIGRATGRTIAAVPLIPAAPRANVAQNKGGTPCHASSMPRLPHALPLAAACAARTRAAPGLSDPADDHGDPVRGRRRRRRRGAHHRRADGRDPEPADRHRERRRRRRHGRRGARGQGARRTAISSCWAVSARMPRTRRSTRTRSTTPPTDFAPVALVAEQPIVLAARNDLAGRTTCRSSSPMRKANQGKMQYGSPGTGSSTPPRLRVCSRRRSGVKDHAHSLSHRRSRPGSDRRPDRLPVPDRRRRDAALSGQPSEDDRDLDAQSLAELAGPGDRA